MTFYTKDDVMYLRPIANVIRKSQKTHNKQHDTTAKQDNVTTASTPVNDDNGMPDWLLNSLPALTKGVKKDLKERGVDVRRSVKESDDKKERRRKGRNVIGTKSGYEKKLENNRREMILGSKRRVRRERSGDGNEDGSGSEEDEFGGFD